MRCVPRVPGAAATKERKNLKKRGSLCWRLLQCDGRGSRFARLSHLACDLLISLRSLGKHGMPLPVDSPVLAQAVPASP